MRHALKHTADNVVQAVARLALEAARFAQTAARLLGPNVLMSWRDYRDYRRGDAGHRAWTARYVGDQAAGSPATRGGKDANVGPAATVVLVTFNRLRMLQRCVATVLANSGDVDYELIVWDNDSTDGTAAYLDSVAARDERIRVVHSPHNVGLNGVAKAVRLARGAYIVEMDDDVVEVPPGWLAEMIRSFDRVPQAGYLAADEVRNATTSGARSSFDQFWTIDYGDGVIVDVGWTGGWCTITSRAVIDLIGNFKEMPGRVFYAEDWDFVLRCLRERLVVGVITGVKVYHATGVAENAAAGCLDVCLLKYSDGPEYRRLLESAQMALDEGLEG